MTLKVGIVGCGGISASHGVGYQQAGVDIVACADIRPERAQARGAEWGARPYASLTEMLDHEALDLLSICTPPGSHTELALEALGRGVPTLVEKPSTTSLADFDAVIAASEKAGVGVYGVFQHRHGTGARRAVDLIASGRAGRPQVAVCETLWLRRADYFDLDWRGSWAGEGAGPTLGHAIHQIDLLLQLMGPWTRVSASLARVARPVEFEDVSAAFVTFESGAVATITTSLLSPRELSRIRVDLTGGTLEVNHLYGYRDEDWTFYPLPDLERAEQLRLNPGLVDVDASADAGNDAWTSTELADEVPSNHAAQIVQLVADLENGRDHETALANTRSTMELITGIFASGLTGQPVERADLVPGHPFYADLTGGLQQSAIDVTLTTPRGDGERPATAQ